MLTSDFSFDLPQELIAQFPPEKRGTSRLMLLDRKTQCRKHCLVKDLTDFLERGSLLVFNNTRVRKARLLGVSSTSGAQVEFLLLKQCGEEWSVIASRAKRRRIGSRYVFPGNVEAEIVRRDGDTHVVRFTPAIDDVWLDAYGRIPLPPYIRREDASIDNERYQTIFARSVGSAAAPTAGLHFTEELLADLDKSGVETAFITLHVGLGTFLPVRTANVEDHTLHEEVFTIDALTATRVEKAWSEKRRVIAVGTTSVRALESAFSNGRLKVGEQSTSIFIYPGYRFKTIDGIFTNFHTPQSSLLFLVSAFAGKDFILDSYREAIRERYRFFSYGDAMLIL
ncbi:MAG: tRNA preQ1(34) S-adenosylmethionine ribosyltransferase-isomerase QueA [Treponema sp.]|jgi:S-adenosylmethionine:tRNA ribosyltransferase-isomerase|nr:tRNA preQ1(34) S-adenosylmethionine ribosyltransferase-isomerase QueA [Treponema sp.]